MATRIDNILINARDSLSDPQGDRWTDQRLLRLINEAQETIALKGRLLRTSTTGTIVSGTATYTAPSDCATVLRIVINNQRIDELTHEELDDTEGAWEDDTGTDVAGVVFDKSNADKFLFYPIPTNPTYTSYKIQYLKVPAEISKTSDNLEIPKIFDKAIKHFVVGSALRDDQDTQSRTVGNEELSLYAVELNEAMKLSGINFSKNAFRSTQYRGFE